LRLKGFDVGIKLLDILERNLFLLLLLLVYPRLELGFQVINLALVNRSSILVTLLLLTDLSELGAKCLLLLLGRRVLVATTDGICFSLCCVLLKRRKLCVLKLTNCNSMILTRRSWALSSSFWAFSTFSLYSSSSGFSGLAAVPFDLESAVGTGAESLAASAMMEQIRQTE